MMFLLGGIPDIYYGETLKRISEKVGNHQFTGMPLRKDDKGAYLISASYCEELITTLVHYVLGRPNCLDEGLGVVLLVRDWETARFEHVFFPFAYCLQEKIGGPITQSQHGVRAAANIYSDVILSTFKRLRKPLKALTDEFRTDIKRTPILLPIQHFGAEPHYKMLRHLVKNLVDAESPHDVIRQAKRDFEKIYPLKKRETGGRFFENDKGVWFTPPGRAFHGHRPANVEGAHNKGCFLNNRLRLGGFYRDGFHYDCTNQGKPHYGDFSDCHRFKQTYNGRPHLNVYPNDYIRA